MTLQGSSWSYQGFPGLHRAGSLVPSWQLRPAGQAWQLCDRMMILRWLVVALVASLLSSSAPCCAMSLRRLLQLGALQQLLEPLNARYFSTAVSVTIP